MARFRVDGALIVACGACGLVRQDTRPIAIEALYGPSYYTADDPKGGYSNYVVDAEVNRRTFRRRIRAIEERLGRRGRLLDVGAALGDLVLEATAAGWDAEGVEISPYAAQVARARGAVVHTGSLEDVRLPRASFDVVTLYDTVEHADDPVALLAEARRLLRPAGLLHIVTPNVGGLQARILGRRWYHYKPGEHLFYFTPTTLRAAAERSGLRWEGWAPSGSYVTVSYVLDRLRYYAPALFGALRRWSRILRLGSLTLWTHVGEMEAWARPERRSSRRPFLFAPAPDDAGPARSAVRRVAPRAAASIGALTILGLVVRDAFAGGHAISVVALACGLVFFLYALKYYVVSASVIFLALFGDRDHSRAAPATTDGVDAPRGRHSEGYRTLRGEHLDAGGSVVPIDAFRTAGSRLPVDRQPFISIHLALYNESRVVDRLLAACTSFDYDQYEVLVVDDSTDETTRLLERWKGPRVSVIHRPSREGFKGGALQEALKRMDPRTEYVIVFDADFVPPADAIWRFLDHFGRLDPAKPADDRVAAVQGYQWHMLNASENWITKGIRAEFSGSYVLERTGQELFGAMKMISGSVYMIRADVLRRLGWSTSITEDWELTIRLYLAGYKVVYTPYIQAPAECVSTVRRLIKQRMRWAEGHTFNVKRYFGEVIASPRLTWQEKVEFLYYAPYYLQSVAFGLGTLAWVLGTFVLHQRLPIWGEILGWSLVVSNALALPLMNLAGVLLEGSLRRDALGLLSFIGLSWLLVPFQAYASVKALIERHEGGWARTPKSGHVTERIGRFRLGRVLPRELPGRQRYARRAGRVQVALVSLFVLVAVGIVTVGALSVRAASASGLREGADYLVPVVLGTALPLLLLVMGWWRLRRAAAALLMLAVCVSVNVAFLANAVPAAAAAGASSDFYLSDGRTAFGCTGAYDMYQAVPTGTGSFSYPGGSGVQDTFCSDTFAAGMVLGAGTTVANLYMWNNSASKTCNISLALLWYHASTATTTSLGTGTTSLAPKTTTQLVTTSLATLAATFLADDRLHFTVTFTSTGANCSNAGFAAGTATYPSRITSATIVPEATAGLVLLAPALPILVGAWRSRRLRAARCGSSRRS
jgi:cellulose synthase/poly-beta-1,6-N-acetylglucosamine synthase-like glycosyltransferase/SAM-dependent methyltransferase